MVGRAAGGATVTKKRWNRQKKLVFASTALWSFQKNRVFAFERTQTWTKRKRLFGMAGISSKQPGGLGGG